MPEIPPYPGPPRWVKVLAIVAAAVVLVLLVLLLLSPSSAHGPRRHLSFTMLAR